jgi:hypothetical protein
MVTVLHWIQSTNTVHSCVFFARHDCGYFVLKFIESWDGRRMLNFKPSDMPAIRKIFLNKWMVRAENLVDWERLLFQK